MEDLSLPFFCVFYLLSISSKLTYCLLILDLCFDRFYFTQEAKEKSTKQWMISSWLIMTYLFVVVQSLSHVWLTLCDLMDFWFLCLPLSPRVCSRMDWCHMENILGKRENGSEEAMQILHLHHSAMLLEFLLMYISCFYIGFKMKKILIKQKLKTIVLYNLLNCCVRKRKRIITRKTFILV